MNKEKLQVITIKDGIAKVYGSYGYTNRELVEFSNGDLGVVLRADEKIAEIAIIEPSTTKPLKIGNGVKPSGKEFSVVILDNILGSIIDISGNHLVEPVNHKPGNVVAMEMVMKTGRPIYTRRLVDSPLHSGILAIDATIAIGLGQRELIIGDRQTGKTAIALNMIYNQYDQDVKMIYVPIGKKRADIIRIHQKLKEKGVLDKTVIVTADADTSSIAKYLAPFSAITIAEYYQARGEDVLIIFDDLSAHADAYREVALLTGAAPGRDAYPGDIFYQHSRLLERAGSFIQEQGGGSITAIPIVETLAGDISGYIPTNVISITDGQIYTSKNLFNAGIKPAIDIPYSVSRISSQAQIPIMKQVSKGLKLLASQYREMQKVATFSSSMADENLHILNKGKVIEILFKQENEVIIPYNVGIILLAIVNKGYFDFFAEKDMGDSLKVIRKALLNFLENDIIGRKLSKAIASLRPEQEEMINKYLTHIILPVIKFHLVSSYEMIKSEKAFQEKFRDVRNDGRVIWRQMQTRGEGVVYDYNIF